MGLSGTTRSKRLWKAIAVGVLVSWIFTGYVWYATWESFVSTKPRQMEIATGRTIPLSSHGIVVYLTVNESEVIVRNLPGYQTGLARDPVTSLQGHVWCVASVLR
jgi:hypothetical protein